LADSALRVLVSALKRVLLPTFGKPTIPAWSIINKSVNHDLAQVIGQGHMVIQCCFLID